MALEEENQRMDGEMCWCHVLGHNIDMAVQSGEGLCVCVCKRERETDGLTKAGQII